MIIASAVSYAAIRGITHGTRGGPGLGGLPPGHESDIQRILDVAMTRDAVVVLEIGVTSRPVTTSPAMAA
jgi:hypothetical protein